MPRKKPRPEITAYPRDYDFDPEPYVRATLLPQTVERAGWCLECKEQPCVCHQEQGSLFDPD